MLTFLVFLKGALIGFVIAAPVGAIGVLCIQRSFQFGFEAGFTTGIGAALADTVYGCIAAFSLTGILHFLLDHNHAIRFFGGIFLIALGVLIIIKPTEELQQKKVINKHWNNIGTTFLLTLTNPTTIFSFLGIFAAMGLGIAHDSIVATVMLLVGVFSGSMLWWIILSGSVSFFHKKITRKTLSHINQFSGGLIFIFGAACLISML